MEYLNQHGFNAESINSQVSCDDRESIMEDLESNSSEIRFFFVTPEMTRSNSVVRELLFQLIDRNVVNYVVVDEAHKIIDSVDYRTAFEHLHEFRSRNNQVPWIVLTTASDNIIDSISISLQIKSSLVLKSSSVRKNIFYDAVAYEGIFSVISYIKSLACFTAIPSGIIFCRRITFIETIKKILNSKGIGADSYHGSRSNEDRVETLMNWSQGNFPVLIATGESFGYGINITVPVTRFVIHIEYPRSLLSFYQVIYFLFFDLKFPKFLLIPGIWSRWKRWQ